MNNCNDTKAHIDKFTSIGERQRQDVYDHIATCEECAVYKEVADSTANLLGCFGAALKQTTGDERAYQQMQQRAKKGRRQTLIALIAMVTSLCAFFWFYSQGNMELDAGVLLLWAAGSGAFAWWSSRKASRFSSVPGKASEAFLQGWAADLGREITIVTVVAAVLAVEIVLSMSSLVSNSFASEGAGIFLCLNAILAIGVGYAVAVELPALKRERSLLEEDA